jgi:hypothetical protein
MIQFGCGQDPENAPGYAEFQAALHAQNFCTGYSAKGSKPGTDGVTFACRCGRLSGDHSDTRTANTVLDEHLEEQGRALREFTQNWRAERGTAARRRRRTQLPLSLCGAGRFDERVHCSCWTFYAHERRFAMDLVPIIVAVVGALFGALIAPAWNDRVQRSAHWRAEAKSASDRRLLLGGRVTSTLVAGGLCACSGMTLLLWPGVSSGLELVGVVALTLGEIVRHRLLASVKATSHYPASKSIRPRCGQGMA